MPTSLPHELSPSPSPWYVWRDHVREPAWNMAVDEAMLRHAGTIGRPLLRLYEWDRPAITLGYFQPHEAAPPRGYTVVRRITGGGLVFHDRELTYSLAIPGSSPLCRLERLESYRWVNRRLAACLGRLAIETDLATEAIPRHVDRARMACFVNPTRYDLLSGGRKIAGAAQRRTGDGILHQGSIRTDVADIDKAVLADCVEQGWRTFCDGTTLPETLQQALIAAAAELVASRYSRDAWNRKR